MIINIKSMFIFFKFQKFLASLHLASFLTSECYVPLFPHAMCPNFTCVFTICLSIFIYNIYLGYEKTDVGRGVILKLLVLTTYMSHFSNSCKTKGEKRNLPLNFNTCRKVWWCFFHTSTRFSIWFSTTPNINIFNTP